MPNGEGHMPNASAAPPQRVLLIPAAGRGTRLKSRLPKPLVPVAGRAMLDWLFDLYAPWIGRFIVVVNPESREAIRAHCAARREQVAFVVQERATGMLDAILLADSVVRESEVETIWVTWADQIAVRAETVRALAAACAEAGAAMALPVVVREHPYTLLERDAAGRIVAVRFRRENDPMPAAGESEMGLFGLSRATYLEELPRFAEEIGASRGTATGERNFLPFIAWLAERRRVVTFPCTEEIEAVGVNTPEELARVEEALRARG